jgi:hypothetical protein
MTLGFWSSGFPDMMDTPVAADAAIVSLQRTGAPFGNDIAQS